jgi:hypothetical protein
MQNDRCAGWMVPKGESDAEGANLEYAGVYLKEERTWSMMPFWSRGRRSAEDRRRVRRTLSLQPSGP